MTSSPPDDAPSFSFDANHLALDFANTLGSRQAERPREHLRHYGDLLAWARLADLLSPSQAERLSALAAQHPAAAEQTLAEARALRETIYRLFVRRASGQEPAPGDLDALNRALARALAHERLRPTPKGIAWGWADDDALDRVLWPVARAAGELLAAAEATRVRICEAAPCGWLFLDTTRNRSRRWCDMRSCGNRAKARRHYARSKAGRSGPA